MTECTCMFQGMRFLVGTSAYQNAATVTPSDTVKLPKTASALWIGGAGNIKVDMEIEGVGITFSSLPVSLFKARITMVYSTGTTATNIVALW